MVKILEVGRIIGLNLGKVEDKFILNMACDFGSDFSKEDDESNEFGDSGNPNLSE